MTNELTDCQKQLRGICKTIAHDLEYPRAVDDGGTPLEDLGWEYSAREDIWTDLDGIEHGPSSSAIHEESGFDYLTDVLDIEYRVGSDRKYKSAEVLVAFGGPNIWIDTKREKVVGAWWGDHFEASYTDRIGLDNALEELYEMGV
jgi:hypothetical protein